MKRVFLLTTICGLLLSGGPLHQRAFADSDRDRPLEPPAPAAVATELQRLRADVESLQAEVKRLQEALALRGANRRAGEPADKERLAAEAARIIAQYKAGKAAMWKQAHGRIRELRAEVTNALQQLQDRSTRDAKLDEALAIREAISCLSDPSRKVLTDPAILYNIGAPGRVLFFRVTGASSGTLYGTGVYTSDSSLAAAVVHAGILDVNQVGVVKVTTIPSYQNFIGSTCHGITSSSWSSYPAFRVEALDDEDAELNDAFAASAAAPGANPDAPKCKLSPKPEDPSGPDAPIDIPRAPEPAPNQPSALTGVAPSPALPADARAHIERFEAAAMEIRKETRVKANRLLRETIDLLTPIQDAHTRAARLDEAIAIRDFIRKLEEGSDRH
jgi:hypothetical protein